MKHNFRALSVFLIVTSVLGYTHCAYTESETATMPEGTWVDLTHDFSSDTVYWPTADTFTLESEFEGITEKGYYYTANKYRASEHGGTHLDSPVHFAEGRQTVDRIPLEKLIGRAVVIDVSEKALADPDYQVSVGDITHWEEENGTIPDNAIVLLDTGYGKYWPDRVKYMGTDKRGPQAVSELHFPGLDPGAAKWLAENRKINAVGLDTPSIDFGQSTLFQSHRILFKENIPAFENVANLDKLPAREALIIALPMKIKGGSGAPLRIIALIPENKTRDN